MTNHKDDRKININLKRDLGQRLLVHALIEISTLITIFTVVIFVGKYICGQFRWSGNELLYTLFKITEYYIPLIGALLCGIGVFILLFRAWKKTLGYLDDVIEATENIYQNNSEYIKLSPELKEVEYKMNQIKLNVKDNERVAKEAEQRKNDLVVYLAHDLKTPLTSVIGYLSLLRDENQISEELRKKYLSISLEKAQRLEDLLNEFFEITRFNLSTLSLELSKVNLTRMLEQIIYEFRPMFLEKNLQCDLDSEPSIMIMCDVDKMQRVFDNLLRNAVNYSFENSSISIMIKKVNDNIKLIFSNHGNTIPKEKLNRIFEQFYRLDTSRTTKSGGSGLGLAITKEIIGLHGGTILANSKNEIISFEVEIPGL